MDRDRTVFLRSKIRNAVRGRKSKQSALKHGSAFTRESKRQRTAALQNSPYVGRYGLRMKIIVNGVVVLAAAAIGLVAGLALRSKRVSQTSESAAVTLVSQDVQKASGMRVS